MYTKYLYYKIRWTDIYKSYFDWLILLQCNMDCCFLSSLSAIFNYHTYWGDSCAKMTCETLRFW